MVELKFYNSRTKQFDLFTHEKSIIINMYTYGPTVYDRVHLGNLKTFYGLILLFNIYIQSDIKQII
jgi:cysteinyl-tRNA synthetase